MKINVSFTAMTLIFVIKIYRTITNDYFKNHIFECFHYMFGFLKSGYIYKSRYVYIFYFNLKYISSCTTFIF